MTKGVTRRRLLQHASGMAALTLCGAGSRAEPLPARPFHLVVGGGPGSVPDLVARVIGDKLSIVMAQPVVVENRPGAGGIIAMQALMSGGADGSMLAIASMSQLVFNSYLFSKLPYDPQHDVAPIAPLVIGALAVAVHPSVPATTFAEFVAYAKSRSGGVTVGTAGNGSPPDVVTRLLVRTAGLDATFVPFRSGPEGLTGVMRGDVQLFVDAPPLIVPQVKVGAVRALAVTGSVREPDLPEVQTLAEAGFPGAQAEAWIGLVARAGTPEDILAALNRAAGTIMTRPDVQEQVAKLSFRPLTGSRDAFRAMIDEGHRRWGAVIREAGLRLD
ncbi:Bug family tripartite tricarboxylate transporter substrate binding protein [Bradyrhizobium sp. 2TAF24]|uniref:Bug family tripartite tricarboxylate transporter substrate binding protein n=1 Tax=Bradyrhizobium sp. 2TAF24 TaxID=3233011 RepID=UPI003F8DB698